MIRPEQEVTGTSDLELVGQKHRGQAGLGTGVCGGVGVGGRPGGTEPLTWGCDANPSQPVSGLNVNHTWGVRGGAGST